MAAKVIFDLGSAQAPGHCSWQARLSLQPSAAFAALNVATTTLFKQKNLVDWLEDWHDVMQPVFADGNNALPRAIAAIRQLKISEKREHGHEQGDFAARRSTLEDIEAKSTDVLPTGFTFIAVPYEGLKSRTFNLRLSVRTSEDTPTLILRWQQKETQIENIADEFRDELTTRLNWPLTLGTFEP